MNKTVLSFVRVVLTSRWRCDYELWKKIKIGSMYRLKYYKYDKSRIILQIDEFKYQDELNKYLINDLSNLIVEYL